MPTTAPSSCEIRGEQRQVGSAGAARAARLARSRKKCSPLQQAERGALGWLLASCALLCRGRAAGGVATFTLAWDTRLKTLLLSEWCESMLALLLLFLPFFFCFTS